MNQFFIIAILDKKIVEFSSLDEDGYLDFMFVLKDFQGQGIADKLLAKLKKSF